MIDRRSSRQRLGPVSARRLAALVACLVCLGLLPLGATTYVPMADGALADQAAVIAEVEIVNQMPGGDGGIPSTEYVGIVRRVVKGGLDRSTITVRVPGGEGPDGWELHIPGLPEFEAGDRALLFLLPNDDDTFSILHWLLGSFRIVELPEQRIALSDLTQANVLGAADEQPLRVLRDYEAFASWLEDRSAGTHREPDYFEPLDASSGSADYTLFTFRGRNLRWFEFDSGQSVEWRFRQVDSAGTLGAYQEALEAWNREASTIVRYVHAGSTGSWTGFRRADGVNAIIFGDPNQYMSGRFECGQGGTLASGGWWTRSQPGVFKGQNYFRIVEGDIVVNDGVECFLRNNRSGAAEMFAHELGHTLGIAHSCGDSASGPCDTAAKDDALMRSTIHNDGRGPSLRADDRAALRRLYQGQSSGGGAVAAPSAMRAWATSSTEGRLSWRDNSSNETEFEIFLRVGIPGTWEFWESAPANTTSFGFINAEPGQTYSFKVRARNGSTVSAFSNEGRVTMPGGGGGGGIARPTNMRAVATSSTEGRLSWSDNSANEAEFEIFLRVGIPGTWRLWETVPANTVSFGFVDAEPGQTYSFKVRGRNGSTVSAFSNEGRVTMPGEGGGGGIARPTNMRAVAISSTEGRLSWRDNSTNEAEFEIFLRVGIPGTWRLWETVPANTVSFGFVDAEPGQTYSFKVRGRSGSTVSAFSNEGRVTMPGGGGGGGIARPTNMRAVATSSTEGRLSWRDNSANEAEFEIFLRVGIPGTWRLWETVPANTTAIGFVDAQSGQLYSFKVRARNGPTVSAFSNEARVTMP